MELQRDRPYLGARLYRTNRFSQWSVNTLHCTVKSHPSPHIHIWHSMQSATQDSPYVNRKRMKSRWDLTEVKSDENQELNV